MTDLEIPADAGGQIISYGITAEDIEAMKQRYAVVRFDTPAEYKAGVAAIAEIRNTRTAIERRRTDLKRIHLETGRKIDAEAARWTALLEQVEAPLKEAKKLIDDAKEAEKKAAEAAKAKALQDKLDAENAARKAELDREAAEVAAAKKALEESRRKLEEQQAAIRAKEEAERKERERLEAIEREERRQREEAAAKAERERLAKIEAEQRAERERLEAERRAVEAEKERLRIEQEAKEKAERLAREAEERRIAELERAAALKAREEALRPDKVKIAAWASWLRETQYPIVTDPEAFAVAAKARLAIEAIADELEAFAGVEGKVSS